MPYTPTVYRHFSKGGQLLYVGSTLNFTQRQAQHQSLSKWFSQVAVITLERFATKEEMWAAEKSAILLEKPSRNILDAYHEDGRPKLVRAIPTYPPASGDHLAYINRIAARVSDYCGELPKLKELAKGSDVRIQTLRKIAGGHEPSLRTLDKLAAYFKKADKKLAKEAV